MAYQGPGNLANGWKYRLYNARRQSAETAVIATVINASCNMMKLMIRRMRFDDLYFFQHDEFNDQVNNQENEV